ncbi:MAG: FHA domain-containing protein [Bacteroidales bacterium]|nr:FHA domain-containing protein [Bacteroidales bacterium]
MQIKVNVNCPFCKQKNQILVKDDMFGRKNFISCSHCLKNFATSIPPKKEFVSRLEKAKKEKEKVYEKNEDNTYIGGSIKKEVFLKLSVLPNEYSVSQVFEIDQKHMTIGRKNSSGSEYKADVEIVTEDMYMGRKHAVIMKKENNAFVIKDLKSANLTWLNGTSLKGTDEFYLEDGDELKLGRTILKINIIDK